MSANEDSTPSPPEKNKSRGQFKKGVCPNPTGRGKGSLSKTTKFLQIMTGERQKKALKVLDKVLKQAEAGDSDSQKIVAKLLEPFLRREAEKDGGGDKRPLININVGVTDGKKPPPARVIDGKTGRVDV